MTEENKNMAAEAVKKEQSAPAKKTENAATSRKIGNKTTEKAAHAKAEKKTETTSAKAQGSKPAQSTAAKSHSSDKPVAKSNADSAKKTEKADTSHKNGNKVTEKAGGSFSKSRASTSKKEGKKSKAKKPAMTKEEKKAKKLADAKKRKENALVRKQKRAEIRIAKKEFRRKKHEKRAAMLEKRRREKLSGEKLARYEAKVQNKKAIAEEKSDKKQAIAQKRAELKKQKAERRAEKVQEKQEKKLSQKKQKAANRLALQKEKEALHRKKAQRREMLKNESKEERKARVALENQEKKKTRLAKKRAAAEKKAERARLKAKRKAERKNRRSVRENGHTHSEKRDARRKNPNMGLVAAVIALGVSALALASLFTVYFVRSEKQMAALDRVYERAFYELTGYVDNVDANLNKLSVSTSPALSRTLTTDLAVEAELAENSLQELPLSDESRFAAAKLLNQIGDYAKYLQKKLEDGELRPAERDSLRTLAESNRLLKKKLASAGETMRTMGKKFRFRNLSAGEANFLSQGFNELSESSATLPKLIYDGPFSDAIENNASARGITGRTVERTEAEDLLRAYFSEYGLTEIMYSGEAAASDTPCYGFTAKMANGGGLYAQISKTGGKLLLFDAEETGGDERLTDRDAIESAAAFLGKIGMKDLTPVWTDSFRGECTVNFAAEQDGVVLYPDLVKVKVDKATGTVIGMEAYSYYLNHHERADLLPRLTVSEAEATASKTLEIKTKRLCIAPLGSGKEELCYEFSGTAGEDLYYVYVSAKTGREVQIFRVVQGTEGTVLM